MLAYWLVLGYGGLIVAAIALWGWSGRGPKRAEPNVLYMTDEERDRKLDEIARRIEGQ